MADSRRYGPGAQLDIEQILLEAQHRWLRPAEICEILRNYNKFRIAPEPANKPPNGSLFLFDRKVLRYFRKDGHNWRKKNDGKTVKEAHERLKAGSIDVLHCYYAHGEDNASFQRRSYWLLEEELSHIVLVHYREVKGSRTHHNRSREAEGAFPNSQHTEESVPSSDLDGSVSTKFQPHSYQVTSRTTDTTSLNSSQTSEYADAESAYNYQSSSRYNSFPKLQKPGAEKVDSALSAPYYPVLSNEYQGKFQAIQGMDFSSFNQVNKYEDGLGAGLTHEPQNYLTIPWENVQEHCTSTARIQSASYQPSHVSAHPTMNIIPEQQNGLLGQLSVSAFGRNQEFGSNVIDQGAWQNIPSASELNHSSRFYEGQLDSVDIFHHIDTQCLHEYNQHAQDSVDGRLAATIDGGFIKTELESNVNMDGQANYAAVKQPLLGSFIKEGLKKLDSFDRWMSNELGDVNESHMRSSSGAYWEAVENSIGVDDSGMASQVQLDTYTLGPSLSQDQLYSIIDFSPNCAGSRSEVEVLIMGRFLKDTEHMTNFNWACMFGEVEVPAEVVSDGVLRCSTPHHEAGRVPFYVTCANRLACSEVREFEFRANNLRDLDVTGSSSDNLSEFFLHMRFGKLLSLGSAGSPDSVPVVVDDFSNFSSQVNSLLKEDDNEWDQILMLTTEEISKEKVRDQLLENLLKEKLHVWLLQKVAEGGKGPSVLDEGGQGVLHFAAALGYDWAIPPTIEAGISINFRDMNGWTALHWAAAYGRERTVGFLISQGAAPGALTDPTPKHPRGRTPADLASSNGHKGMAGFLAASALSSHLSSLKLKESEGDADVSALEAVHTVAERTETPISVEDFQHESSLKDTLAAVCKATQAAARIHQVFRVQSFQQKQLKEYGDGEFGMSDDRALSLIALKTNKAGRHDEPVHTAATRIQNKFRSYKGRKDYLIIRQQIVKIQAHVRGHQVRKNYRKIIWSVGILDKVILRWKRKGRGLSLFKPEALPEGISMLGTSKNEDEYDFLKEGRRQTEERLEKALARVKSMVQYPEARDQYRRLLNVVSEIQETKAANDREMSKSDESIADYFDEDLIELEALLGDDTFMSP